MKILVLNGPNINMLGVREPDIYGKETYTDLCEKIRAHAARRGIYVEIRQTNHEGVLVDIIQSTHGVFDGIVFNPAAYTHTSIAIADAVRSVGIPTVEVHISDTEKREDFRKRSYVRPTCIATVMGHGTDGYTEAMDMLIDHENKN